MQLPSLGNINGKQIFIRSCPQAFILRSTHPRFFRDSRKIILLEEKRTSHGISNFFQHGVFLGRVTSLFLLICFLVCFLSLIYYWLCLLSLILLLVVFLFIDLATGCVSFFKLTLPDLVFYCCLAKDLLRNSCRLFI